MSARLKFAFQAQKDTELDVEKGSIVKLVEKVNDFWYKCSIDGKHGLVQANYMEILEEIPAISSLDKTVLLKEIPNGDNRKKKEKKVVQTTSLITSSENTLAESNNKTQVQETPVVEGNEDEPKNTNTIATETIEKDRKSSDRKPLSLVDKVTVKKWMKLTDLQYEKVHSPGNSICQHLSTEHIVTFIDFCQLLGTVCALANKNVSFRTFSQSIGYIFALTVLDFGAIFAIDILSYIVGASLTLYQWFSLYLFYKWGTKYINILKKKKKRKDKQKVNDQKMHAKAKEYNNKSVATDKKYTEKNTATRDYVFVSKLGWKLQLVALYILYLPSCRFAMVLGNLIFTNFNSVTLQYITLSVCWIPLVLNMMFMILMINKYTPKVYGNDELFGRGQPLENHAEVKYYDILHHSEEHLKSPFRFLHAPFKRQRRFTRIFHLGFKATATLLLYSNSSNPIKFYFYGQSFYSFIYLIFPGPFTSEQTNRVHINSAVTLWLLATVITQSENNASSTYQIPLFLTLMALLVCYLLINVLLVGKISTFIKVFRKLFKFEDTSTAVHKMGFLDVIKAWDIGMEIKHRLWHPFWNILLLQHSGSDIAKRWIEIQDLVSSYGISRTIDHFKQVKANPDILEARHYLMSTCEGVDCWYNPNMDEETEIVNNYFCKLEIIPFPFTCNLFYDSGKKVTLYDGDSILKLAAQNKTSISAIRKETRLTLRAMAKKENVKVNFPYKEGRYEPVKVKNGVVKDIDMDLTFENGVVVIEALDGSVDIFEKPGFNIAMNYTDGFGRCEHQSREYTVHDRLVTIGLDDLGIDKDFSPIEDVDHCIVTSGKLLGDEDIGTLEYDVKTLIYEKRKALYDTTTNNEKTLPTSFWWEIFNAPGLSRTELIGLLKKLNKTSPGIFKVYEYNTEAFDYIYARMGNLQGDPAAEMWYIFWHDIWVHNRNLFSLRSLRKKLDPSNPNAICYNLMERENLEIILKKAKVLNSNKESDNLFSQGMLDLLYFRLSKLREWSEISTSSTSRHAKGEIVHMNTMQTRHANEKLQPMLQRAKERGHDVVGILSKNKYHTNVMFATSYVGIWYIVINVTCLASIDFCGSNDDVIAGLQIAGCVLFMLLVFLALKNSKRINNFILCCAKHNTSSKYNSSKVQPGNEKVRGESPRDLIRWWKGDEEKEHINFNEHASVMQAAQVSLRKGKSCEVEAEMSGEDETIWNEFAVKHYNRSIELLDLLPLDKTFSQISFVKDRLASLTVFFQKDDTDCYESARNKFVLTAELWLRVLHQKLVEGDGVEEAKKCIARAYQRACLCALCQNRWDVVQDLIKEAGEYLPEIKNYESVKLLLSVIEVFFSLEKSAVHNQTEKWMKEWKLTRWYGSIFKIISQVQSTRVEKASELTKPDHDAEFEDCKSLIKIILVGKKGSGKTNLFVRYLYNTYVSDPNIVLGSKSEYSKIVKITDEEKYKIIVEEVNEPKAFKKMKDSVYCVIYSFDNDDEDHEEWLKLFKFWSGTLTIAKTKIDENNKSNPNIPEHIHRWVEKNVIGTTNYFSVSAKTGIKVRDVFENAISRCGKLLGHLHD
jgi:hypothetical protein